MYLRTITDGDCTFQVPSRAAPPPSHFVQEYLVTLTDHYAGHLDVKLLVPRKAYELPKLRLKAMSLGYRGMIAKPLPPQIPSYYIRGI